MNRKWIRVMIGGMVLLAACQAGPSQSTVSPAVLTTPFRTGVTVSTTPAQAFTPTSTIGPTHTFASSLTPTSTPITISTHMSTTPTATQMPCLDHAAQPRNLPPRQTPLEVQYNNDGNLWAWSEGTNQAVQVSTTGDAGLFTFSPDGQVAVFDRGTAESQQEVWTIRRDGTGLRRLLSADKLHQWGGVPTVTNFEFNVDAEFVRWSSGYRLGIKIMRNYHGVGGCCESLGYWLVDVEIGMITAWTPPVEITSTPYGDVAPNGNLLAFWGDGGVNFTTRDGWLLHWAELPYITLGAGEGTGRMYPQMVWAPDSQSLAAVTFTEDYTSDQSTFTTWRVPIDGSPAMILATFTASPYSVQVSPDLKYLLYTRMDAPNSNQRTLHLATFDGKQDLAYAQGEGMEGDGWAPDGFHFLFWQYTKIGSVCGGSQSLFNPPLSPVRDIQWVDATHFLFVAGAYGDPNAELRLGEVGGASILIGRYGAAAASSQFVADDAALGK